VIQRLVHFALHQRFVILALALLLVFIGIVAFARLPIEAYPDVADVEVDVITLWPGHAPEEVERHIIIPLEKELNGIARVTFLRSISIVGLSNVCASSFPTRRMIIGPASRVLERISQADIPADAKPQLGPLASFVISEVYRYTRESKTMPLVELKTLQDWVLEREFRKVPGAADVVSWGGGIKQYRITIDLARLRAYNLTVRQVFDAMATSNPNAGGSYVPRGEVAHRARHRPAAVDPGHREHRDRGGQEGTPVRVRDIGQVGIGNRIRLGMLGRDHADDLVQGIVLMRKGENPGEVIQGVQRKFEELKSILPAGVELRPYCSRDALVRTTVL